MGTMADVIEELIMACIKKTKAMYASNDYTQIQEEIDSIKERIDFFLSHDE
jgi:hypothetical protein